MTRILVRRTRIEDVEYLIDHIREADKKEIEAVTGKPFFESVFMALEYGDEAWTGLYGDKVMAIFGMHVTSYVTGHAVPWLISTHHVEEHPKVFLRYCKPVFKKLCVGLDFLVNYVDDRNVLAKQWLTWLGFKLEEPEPYGVFELPFRRFTLEVKDV